MSEPKTLGEAVTAQDLAQFTSGFASLLTTMLAQSGALQPKETERLLRSMAAAADEHASPGYRHLVREFEHYTAQMLDLPQARGMRHRSDAKPPSKP